jgi:hypothetical protein
VIHVIFLSIELQLVTAGCVSFISVFAYLDNITRIKLDITVEGTLKAKNHRALMMQSLQKVTHLLKKKVRGGNL